MRAFFRLADRDGHVEAEVWGRSGWKPYEPTVLDWSKVGFADPFDQDRSVTGDLVIYVNKGWQNETLTIGLFENNVPSEVVISRMARVLPVMIAGFPHKMSIPLAEGGTLKDIDVSDLRRFPEKLSLPDAGFAELDRHNASLSAVLNDLSVLVGSEHIKVFGSVARGKQVPGDVDLYVDLDGLEPDAEKALTGSLMRLARKHYGMVDPFLDKGGVLYTRNDQATGWQKAKQSSKMRAAGRSGAPFDEVRIIGRPYEAIRPLEPSFQDSPRF